MKVIIIDNQDSFTYNLFHYVNTFIDNVDVFRANKINIEEIAKYDKIILSPGPGLPHEHPSLELIIERYYLDKSILGVCLGHQSIAKFFNAKIENMSCVKHGVQSVITHNNNCYLFNDLPKSFNIGHYHSWIVSKDLFPKSLIITSQNNDNFITSFKHIELDIRGVQFHPESVLTDCGLRMIENWVKY